MTLQQLKYVIAVADSGSINKAAKDFFLSQPAVSGAIRELEEEAGLNIFSRTNRGVSVTPEGQEFLSYARQLSEQYDLMEERFIKKQVKRKFGVSCQHYSFAVSAFVELVRSEGMEKYEFSISETRTADVIDDVKSFRSEIGVLFMDDFNREIVTKLLRQSSLAFEELFTCHAYVYISASHPLSSRSRIRFEDLKPYPNLSFDQGSNNAFYFAEEILSTYDYDRTIKANDRATMCNLMTGLNGYTLCSGIICEELNGNGFRAIPFEDDEIMHIGYIRREDAVLSRLGSQYIEALKKYKEKAV